MRDGQQRRAATCIYATIAGATTGKRTHEPWPNRRPLGLARDTSRRLAPPPLTDWRADARADALPFYYMRQHARNVGTALVNAPALIRAHFF